MNKEAIYLPQDCNFTFYTDKRILSTYEHKN